MIKITECPRDAMQSYGPFIPTLQKIEYLQSLLDVGFHVLDFGSFVSSKAIPQLKDTAEVLDGLDLSKTRTKLLAIVASRKGAEKAVKLDKITFLGFPFSFSPTFLKKNLNCTIDEALQLTQYFFQLCNENNKTLLQYISMAFGNPYGDEWSVKLLYHWVQKFYKIGIRKITLSDITAESKPETVFEIYQYLIQKYPEIEFGFHLHTENSQWEHLVDSAFKAGCRCFDTVLNNRGGCPMTGKSLLQNLSTFDLISYLEKNKIQHSISFSPLNKSLELAKSIFEK